MGNKLTCSCAPLIKKAYRYEDSPWQTQRRRDGHLLRLWAEVFHVSGTGTVKWQQVSEDLVPVNVTCIQDTPEVVFHITAYNSQVDKILDVRLVQPGTRIGQASECFVYWKDPATGDTWGLNFTSPLDAKQFRECCSPSFKFSRKASSSYSLKSESAKKQARRKPQSTPSSPSQGRKREPQCTCMTPETLAQLQRMRSAAMAADGRSRYSGGSSSLPRSHSVKTASEDSRYRERRLTGHPSSSSMYDNVPSSSQDGANQRRARNAPGIEPVANNVQQHEVVKHAKSEANLHHNSVNRSEQNDDRRDTNEEEERPEYAESSKRTMPMRNQNHDQELYRRYSERERSRPRTSRSKSTDNVFEAVQSSDPAAISLDSNTLKKMLNPLPTTSSDKNSPEQDNIRDHALEALKKEREREIFKEAWRIAPPSAKAAFERRAQMLAPELRQSLGRAMQLDFEHSQSPDHLDLQCYLTTPTSSSGAGDNAYLISEEAIQGLTQYGYNLLNSLPQRPGSPTSRLLLEYEMHLRNTLARGLDAESYSLHTFETLLSQSMENVVALMSEVHAELEAIKMEEKTLIPQSSIDERLRGIDHRSPSVATESSRAHTLPLSHSMRSSSMQSATTMGSISAASSFDVNSGHLPGIIQQASIDSVDSKIYLTSSEMSDDDRLSLTTAISDDDDTEISSPYRSRSGAAAASFNCTGAVRKAGFLSVKKWLLRKRHQVELARKRGWKGYWVCLKGTTLLFYPCESRDGRTIDNTPKHLIIVDGAIMQPIPEHPKREFIFCLSTAFGDAYLFQAPCQSELETWIGCIHSACAAAFARHRGKTGTLHLLQEEIYRLEKDIESDSKMKHMAELQLSVVTDFESKQPISNQISQWEENLERSQCEQFRLRCYMASLQNSELPNPKNLLTHVSKNTKVVLNRLGVFTVSSFHAYVCARSPSLLTNLLSGRGATKRRGLLSRTSSTASNTGSRRSLQPSEVFSKVDDSSNTAIRICCPDGQALVLGVKSDVTAEELLAVACSKKQLTVSDHFLRFKRKESEEFYVPHRQDIVANLTYDMIELCAKILYQVELCRTLIDHMFGFSVEAELIENSDHQDELCVYVSRVEDGSLAHTQGLIKEDEIMVINGAIVSDLDMMYIESVMQEELSLCMMVRSSRLEPPEMTNLMKSADDYIEQLVCPPPPTDLSLSEEMIGKLIVPAPIWGSQERGDDHGSPMSGMSETISDAQQHDGLSSEQIENLLRVIQDSCRQTAEQVTEYCRSPSERRSSLTSVTTGTSIATSTTSSQNSSIGANKTMPDAEKLRKVILELVDTERTYVNHLNSLLEHYLEPMKKAIFLSNSEISTLFGNIQEIVQFQRVFLQNLEDALKQEPNFHHFDQPSQFKDLLFNLGQIFLRYADRFKLYSSFCASHSKAQKVLHPGEMNAGLLEFLQSKNPKQQHAFSLESYLIKPIQRILKYPLLLQQLRLLTEPGSQEHAHLSEALKGMEKVAEHINEMQRIHEEYGAIFDHLFRQHFKSAKQYVDLSPGELLYYGGVEWLNISDFLGKIKKGLELHSMCFVFKTAVVFLCKERIRQKKKLMGGTTKAGHSEVEIIRYQVLIPVTEVQVRASSMKDIDSHFMWELIHLKSQIQRRSEKVFHLSNSTNEFRNAFLKTIRLIIRESVRNMTVPTNKPNMTRDKYSTHGRKSTPDHHLNLPQSYSRTLSTKKKAASNSLSIKNVPQRHSAGNIDNQLSASVETYDNVDQNFRTRSKTVGDSMDDIGGSERDLCDGNLCQSTSRSPSPMVQSSEKTTRGVKPNLGAPSHLSLSTTSTLSNSSTGSSSAKLVHSSHPPSNYQPAQNTNGAGSPVWKPRDAVNDVTMTISNKNHANRFSTTAKDHHTVCDEYGGSVYMTPPSVHKQDHYPKTSTFKPI
ncbi:TIAM1 (predicted) [Pycnogonum litorale]